MAVVVFMRGVNVGGHRTFRPAALAKDLAAYDVVSIGAAGTFVVRGTVGKTVLRAEILRRLPFEAEVILCPARAVTGLVAEEPFPRGSTAAGIKRYVSVLAKRPAAAPRFPLGRPATGAWQVRLLGVHGPFVLSLHRWAGKTLLYPNTVVEKELGVPATTRGWDTLGRIVKALEAG
jgi:uncharacterized protein (DUF1697 family)